MRPLTRSKSSDVGKIEKCCNYVSYLHLMFAKDNCNEVSVTIIIQSRSFELWAWTCKKFTQMYACKTTQIYQSVILAHYLCVQLYLQLCNILIFFCLYQIMTRDKDYHWYVYKVLCIPDGAFWTTRRVSPWGGGGSIRFDRLWKTMKVQKVWFGIKSLLLSQYAIPSKSSVFWNPQ